MLPSPLIPFRKSIRRVESAPIDVREALDGDEKGYLEAYSADLQHRISEQRIQEVFGVLRRGDDGVMEVMGWLEDEDLKFEAISFVILVVELLTSSSVPKEESPAAVMLLTRVIPLLCHIGGQERGGWLRLWAAKACISSCGALFAPPRLVGVGLRELVSLVVVVLKENWVWEERSGVVGAEVRKNWGAVHRSVLRGPMEELGDGKWILCSVGDVEEVVAFLWGLIVEGEDAERGVEVLCDMHRCHTKGAWLLLERCRQSDSTSMMQSLMRRCRKHVVDVSRDGDIEPIQWAVESALGSPRDEEALLSLRVIAESSSPIALEEGMKHIHDALSHPILHGDGEERLFAWLAPILVTRILLRIFTSPTTNPPKTLFDGLMSRLQQDVAVRGERSGERRDAAGGGGEGGGDGGGEEGVKGRDESDELPSASLRAGRRVLAETLALFYGVETIKACIKLLQSPTPHLWYSNPSTLTLCLATATAISTNPPPPTVAMQLFQALMKTLQEPTKAEDDKFRVNDALVAVTGALVGRDFATDSPLYLRTLLATPTPYFAQILCAALSTTPPPKTPLLHPDLFHSLCSQLLSAPLPTPSTLDALSGLLLHAPPSPFHPPPSHHSKATSLATVMGDAAKTIVSLSPPMLQQAKEEAGAHRPCTTMEGAKLRLVAAAFARVPKETGAVLTMLDPFLPSLLKERIAQ